MKNVCWPLPLMKLRLRYLYLSYIPCPALARYGVLVLPTPEATNPWTTCVRAHGGEHRYETGVRSSKWRPKQGVSAWLMQRSKAGFSGKARQGRVKQGGLGVSYLPTYLASSAQRNHEYLFGIRHYVGDHRPSTTPPISSAALRLAPPTPRGLPSRA